MCRVSILQQNVTLHSIVSAATHPPSVKSIGWTVLDFIPAFIREKNMLSPSLRSLEYSVLITNEASKLKNGS